MPPRNPPIERFTFTVAGGGGGGGFTTWIAGGGVESVVGCGVRTVSIACDLRLRPVEKSRLDSMMGEGKVLML